MRLFVSHAHDQARIADELTIALRQEGHAVFLDRDALKAGGDYHAIIRDEIRQSDVLVFLVSPQSLNEGGYALSEMAVARERWPDPTGHVLPVITVPTPFDTIPPYLGAVTVLQPRGNLVAETVARVADMQAEAEARAKAERAQAGARRRRTVMVATVLIIVASVALALGVRSCRGRTPAAPCLLAIRVTGPTNGGETGGVTTLDVGPPGAIRAFLVSADVANVDVPLTGPHARWTIEPSTADGRRIATFRMEGCPSAPTELRDDAAKVLLRVAPR